MSSTPGAGAGGTNNANKSNNIERSYRDIERSYRESNVERSYRDMERSTRMGGAATDHTNSNNNHTRVAQTNAPAIERSYRDVERSYRDVEKGHSRRYGDHANDNDEDDIQIGVIGQQPAKYREMNAEQVPQPDYHSWSTASLFLCFIWGIFAFRASERVRKFNRLREYNHAAYHSAEALRKLSFVVCKILFINGNNHACLFRERIYFY